MRAPPRARIAIFILLAALLLRLAQPGHAAVTSAAIHGPSSPGQEDVVELFLPSDASLPEQQLLAAINQVRWEQGRLPPLKANTALERAARSHSQNMAENDFFGHKGADGSSPWDRIDAAAYGNWYVLAENIAAGYEAPEQVVKAWMDSPRHRDNLLSQDLYEAGLGLAVEPDDTYPGMAWGYKFYWTLDMGTRWDAFPLVINREAYSTSTPLVSLYLYGQGWATEARLSNDGVTWSEWQPFRSMQSWELSPGNGSKRVSAQMRNKDGEIVEATDTIVVMEPEPPENVPFLVSPQNVLFILAKDRFTTRPRLHRFQIVAGDKPPSWRATWDQNWVRLNTTAGTAPSNPALGLTYRARLLSPGTYTATLSFEGQDGRVDVPVTLVVLERLYTVYLPLQPKEH